MISLAPALGLVLAAAISSSETVVYKYDAKGRLIKVERSQTANNSVKTDYTHDRANNRRRVKVTGSSN